MSTPKAGLRQEPVFRRSAHFPLSVLRINGRTVKSGERDPKWNHEIGFNIGLDGLGVSSEKRLPAGANVMVEFLLPGENSTLLKADARLRWSKRRTTRGKQLYYMNLEFIRLNPRVKDHIQQFLDEPY